MEPLTSQLPHEKATVLYEGTLHFRQVKEYGIHFLDLLTGKEVTPPEGARFDIAFTGYLQGPRLQGEVSGTDYVSVRADGRVRLHIHGSLDMADGASVAFFAEAVGTRNPEETTLWVRENVVLYSAFPAYSWVNNIAAWSETTIKPLSGEILIKAFALSPSE